MHRSAATIVSRDVALAADETIGLSSVSANRSTPAAQSQADRADANRKTITRYVDGPLDSARQEGRPRAALRHFANQQTSKRTRRPTSTGMQRRALVAHMRVDHDRDALEAAVAEQRLDVQPMAVKLPASRIMQHASCDMHVLLCGSSGSAGGRGYWLRTVGSYCARRRVIIILK